MKYLCLFLSFFLISQGLYSDALNRSRDLLAADSQTEPRPRSFLIQELRNNGDVRETLQILIPENEEDEPVFLLNGNPVNPETDSLGRFDNFADNFPTGNPDSETDSESGASGDPQDGLPSFETMQIRRDRGIESIGGSQTRVFDVEFITRGGDSNRGKLWIHRDTEIPVRLQYDAKTPFLVSATTTSNYFPDPNGGIQRQSLEIMFRIGVLMLSRTYRMLIEY